MAEFNSRLKSIYAGPQVSVTPAETLVYMGRVRTAADICAEIDHVVPQEVLEKFVNNGFLDGDRFDVFINSLDVFTERYGEEELSSLRSSHIKKDGGINWRKYERSRK